MSKKTTLVPTSTADIQMVEVGKLLLDEQNPRLPDTVVRLNAVDQRDIITWIAKNTNIEDLMLAISQNGYFPGEPVVAHEHETRKGYYTVVEGNRRLTAVKLLLDPFACDKPSAAIKDIAHNAVHKPAEMPVVMVDSRVEVLPYLGYRHITGVEEWGSLPKARYMRQLLNAVDSSVVPLDERYKAVARTIGSRQSHVRRSLDALAVYDVIERNDFFDIDGLGEETVKFSIMATALSDQHIAQYIGLDLDNAVSSKTYSKLKVDKVEDLARWMFEKRNGRTVLGESRNLRQLASVVSTPHALKALKAGSSLTIAYSLTKGVAEDFAQHLYSALEALQLASGIVADIDDGSEAMPIAERIHRQIDQIVSVLRGRLGGGNVR